MTIKANVFSKRVTLEGEPVIVCGNSDYRIEFTFDDEWDPEQPKTACLVYLRDGRIIREDINIVEDAVDLPPVYNTREVKIGVFSSTLRTTTSAFILCKPSILCGTGAQADIVPSQYEAITARLAALEAGQGGGAGGGGITAEQVSALDGMFKIASYSTDEFEAYTAFCLAFGLPAPENKTQFAWSLSDGISPEARGAKLTTGVYSSATLTETGYQFIPALNNTLTLDLPKETTKGRIEVDLFLETFGNNNKWHGLYVWFGDCSVRFVYNTVQIVTSSGGIFKDLVTVELNTPYRLVVEYDLPAQKLKVFLDGISYYDGDYEYSTSTSTLQIGHGHTGVSYLTRIVQKEY